MNIVLDTNILISGIFWNGPPSKVLEFWVSGRFHVFATKNILKEYFEVLRRIDRQGELSEKWIMFIRNMVVVIPDKLKKKLSRDPKDDMFLGCALSARVPYLVSGDKDLLVLKHVSGVRIVTPVQFLKILTTQR